jgi:hypothetical protein
MKSIVVVVGYNRSGTSLVCQALERLGVSFGSPLVEADRANPRGYYEHKDIVDAQTRYMLECCDGHGFDDIGSLELLPDKKETAVRLEKRLNNVLFDLTYEYELPGIKVPYWPRIDEVWWSVIDDYSPIFIHAMRHPSQVLHSILKANNTESKLTDEREHRFLREWAWHNSVLFDLHPQAEIWFEDWWPDADVNMKKLAGALGVTHEAAMPSTEGLLL